MLHSFSSGNDGDGPWGTPIFDKSQNNLFGTTYYGGGVHCKKMGCGTIFQISTNGAESVLHTFLSGKGVHPHAGLVRGNGGYYGTTTYGGINCNGLGCGVVFKIKLPK